jgi:hypothetical protein
MDVNLQQRKKGLSTKIPDIEQTLSVVLFLQRRRQKALGQPVTEDEGGDAGDDLDDLDDEGDAGGSSEEPLKTLFELNDTLYAEAEVQETGEVGLWLGVSPAILSFSEETVHERGLYKLISVHRQVRCCCIRCKKLSSC